MSEILGIDFGTSQTLCAHLNSEGFPEIALFSAPASFLASDMIFDGSWKCLPPEPKPLEDSQVKVFAFKRAMAGAPVKPFGRKLALPFSWNLPASSVKLSGKEFPIEEALKPLFSELKKQCEKFKAKSFIFSVPAAFDESKTLALIRMFEAADLKPLTPVKNSTAAAAAYWVLKKKRGRCLVLYLGAGYFEAAAVSFTEKGVEILSRTSSSAVAGTDLDVIIAENLMQEISANTELNLYQDAAFVDFIIAEAERAKCALSHRGSYDFRLRDDKKGIQFVRAFSRYELEQWIGPRLNYAAEAARKVTAEAGLAPEDIEEVLLCGGGSRMPLIQKLLEPAFGKKIRSEINPEHAAALGAAAYALTLKSPPECRITERV